MAALERTVDRHIKNLCLESDEVNMNRYSIKQMNYISKLDLLIMKESILLKRQRRGGELCLRMKGVTQSYDIYHSVLVKPLKSTIMWLKKERRDAAKKFLDQEGYDV